MKFLFGLVLCIFVSSGHQVNSDAAIPAKRYKVDLDAPPTKRWLPVLKQFDRSLLLAVIDTLENEYIKSKVLIELAEYIGKDLEKYIPQPYADEMLGIAQYYNITVGQIVLGNIAYDVSAWNTDHLQKWNGLLPRDIHYYDARLPISVKNVEEWSYSRLKICCHIATNKNISLHPHLLPKLPEIPHEFTPAPVPLRRTCFPRSIMGCTSIVVVDKKGGIIHGRNLDYDAASRLRDVTVEIEFQQSGKTLFIATTYVGYVGVLTASKPMAFTLSGDQRNEGRLIENIISAFEKHWPTMLMSREVMTHATNYDSAVKMLVDADTISPMYFIVGGMKPREGVVIVRDRWGAVNMTKMDDTTHNWFVLETNYDPWKKPPASDDRRDTALWAMKEVGQARMDLESLYEVLSIPPVFNHDTTYTTIMSAADDAAYRTMIRYDHPDYEN